MRITALGVATIVTAAVPFARGAGLWSAGRFAAVALGAFALQQSLVLFALRTRDESEPTDLDAVDALTLSRGLGAAIVAGAAASGARDRRGYAAKLAWPIAVCGATLTDWIDGPLARRRGRGPTRLGRLLDLELDSWLTLATAVAATRFGRLHPLCLLSPSLRYAALLSPVPYEQVFAVGKTERARNLGIAQMALALASFAPFAGTRSTGIARVGSGLLVPIHVAALGAALSDARRARTEPRVYPSPSAERSNR